MSVAGEVGDGPGYLAIPVETQRISIKAVNYVRNRLGYQAPKVENMGLLLLELLYRRIMQLCGRSA